MFERFTHRARQVVVLAQDEARAFGHDHIGTEHILLGLLREEEGLAARVLESLGVTLAATRAQVRRVDGVGEPPQTQTGQIPFTPPAKRVMELALKEALTLAHLEIGTEHLLLGLVDESECVAARILLDFGADRETVRKATIGLMQTHTENGFSQTKAAVDVAIEALSRATGTAEAEKHLDVAVQLGELQRRLRELRGELRD